jgi:hypothetical protein
MQNHIVETFVVANGMTEHALEKPADLSSRPTNNGTMEGSIRMLAKQFPDMRCFRLHAITCLRTTHADGNLRSTMGDFHHLPHGLCHAPRAGLSVADLTGIG